MNSFNVNKIDQIYCNGVMRTRSNTYRSALRLLPKRHRDAISILYAFLREPDDIVDEISDLELKNRKFQRWLADWELAWKNPEESINPVLRSASILFKEKKITWEESLCFLDSMKSDLSEIKMPNMQDLEDYMYGSAGVVGVMIVKIILDDKNISKKTFNKAALLGNAMQLTNFLRDIEEDYEQRKRIYLSKEILEKYKINENYWKNKIQDESWANAIKEYVELAESWFEESVKELEVFPYYLRFPLRYSAKLYRAYLKVIKKNNYQIWGRKVSLGSLKKFSLIFQS